MHSEENKNKLGLLKNEIPNDVLMEYVGVRSKTYALMTLGQMMTSRAKGVSKCYRQKIPFESYRDCVLNISKVTVRQVGLQSKNHVNMLVESTKTGFSSLDDKRWLLCKIHSVPYGSKLIEYQKLNNGACYLCQFPHIIA